MIDQLAELVSGLTAIAAGTTAFLIQPTDQAAQAHAMRAGAAGEHRVARALDRAGVPAVHDITLKDRRGTHQIDHIAAAGDALYVLETKTWRGDLDGQPEAQFWTLRKPTGTTQRVYNPLLQNETHRDVVRRFTQVPVIPLVVFAGHVRLAEGPFPAMLPLARAIMAVTGAGPASGRAMAALDALARFREQPRQAVLATAHSRRMRRQKPTKSRQLWALAVSAALVFVALATQRVTLG